MPDVVMKYNGSVVTTYRVISDHLGSPVMAVNVNNSNDVPFKAEYSAFGERTVTTVAASEGWMPFGFAGGLYDEDTGLTRFGLRDFDPETGRWTAKDPIGWDGGQVNLYGYVGAQPISSFDPQGTGPSLCAVALVACAGLTIYEAASTVMSFGECMASLENTTSATMSSGDTCDMLAESPDRDLARDASKCMSDLGPGLARTAAEETVCAGMIAAACMAPTP